MQIIYYINNVISSCVAAIEIYRNELKKRNIDKGNKKYDLSQFKQVYDPHQPIILSDCNCSLLRDITWKLFLIIYKKMKSHLLVNSLMIVIHL